MREAFGAGTLAGLATMELYFRPIMGRAFIFGTALFFLVLVPTLFLILVRTRRRGSAEGGRPEALILEEAEMLEAMAPGLEARARVISRRKGPAAKDVTGHGLDVQVRGADPADAFERGARVRLLDWSEGVFTVEAADAEHLVH